MDVLLRNGKKMEALTRKKKKTSTLGPRRSEHRAESFALEQGGTESRNWKKESQQGTAASAGGAVMSDFCGCTVVFLASMRGLKLE